MSTTTADLAGAPDPTPTITERHVLDALHRRYSTLSRRYIVAEHVPNCITTTATWIADYIAQDTIAARIGPDGRRTLAYMPGGSEGESRRQLHGHEVKVTRSDWLRELRDPTKAQAWSRYCDRWWLVAPPGVALPDELPAGWGLLTLTDRGLRATVTAPRLDPEPMTDEARIALMRAIQTTATRQTTRGDQP